VSGHPVLIVDDPRPLIRRLTLNRPEKRNALNDELRGSLFDALRAADRADDVSVVIIRGGGPCFSAGYDLGSVNSDVERAIGRADGWWSRHVVNNWFEMWDMNTPIIAQVHGYCLAGGTELATACDLVYVSDDAQVGYPPVRLMSPPDGLAAGDGSPAHRGLDEWRRRGAQRVRQPRLSACHARR
jgi:enoyl-CoA hydratase